MIHFLRLTFFWFLLAGSGAQAQTLPDTTRPAQLDLSDLGQRWFHVKLVPGADSLHPDKPQWAVLPSLNYSPATGVAVGGILTTAFYPKHTPHTRLSTGQLYVGYSQYNQTFVSALSNIWTREHRFNIQGDYRFHNFPTTTFGLGSNTQLANVSAIDYNHIRFYQTIYAAVGRDYMLGAGYLLDHHFSITNVAPDGQPTDFDRYGRTAQSTSSGVAVGLLRDRRGNPNNPTGGSYLLVQYRYFAKALGGSSNWQAIWFDYRRYVSLGGRLEKQMAFWSFNWATFGGRVPYLDLPATGWDSFGNTGRGYTLGRFRGPTFFYAEAEYRTQLTANGLFGAVLFANAQTVHNWLGSNTLLPIDSSVQGCLVKVWPGFGGGIRVKVNKNARTNLAIDYGLGAGGSSGLYFNLNEVF
ncbi:BamA/TamA family outer membrane protein [Fibrella sp. HMF5335]|uniref:BamA/TamA family outer membrane protein n=1 Tax=Fibrella rubiginis TaxID=2817060 RepID=A0A939GJX4_9BACT|nr:BamA/TamA family outer membrane protein [Fibrella rubiginis]MBO0938795.1 BamA/TamA family outer membrane protein [Fibrella rubiginis]